MAYDVTGRVKLIKPLESGISKDGNEWRKQIFVITVEQGNYPKDLAFVLWGDNTKALEKLSIGDNIKVVFNIESREFNDRWYTDLKAFKIIKIEEKDLIPPDDFKDTDREKQDDTKQDTTTLEDEIMNDNDSNYMPNIDEDSFKDDNNEDDLPF